MIQVNSLGHENHEKDVLLAESKFDILSVSSNEKFKDDPLSVLFESDWKNFNFARKKSCILSNINSTCVTKAINHLESLQITIENCMSKIEENWSLQNQFLESTPIGTGENNQENNESGEPGLEISPLDKNRVGSIINEIMNLIIRLEFQRRRATTMLTNERLILDKLKSEIEGMALRKAKNLPIKVQAEHDACVTDITELNWHIAFNLKTERKFTRRCDIAQKLFHQLTERISVIKEMTPQIEEKCKFEKELLKRIQLAQKDIDQLLAKTRDRLRDVQEKLELANQKASKEREAYEAELNASRWELNKAKKRLQDAIEVSQNNVKTIEESTSKIKSNEIEEKKEATKRTDLKSVNDSLREKFQTISGERYRVQKEIDRVRAENNHKADAIKRFETDYGAELANLGEKLNKKSEKLDKILKKKLEKEVNIEEMNNDRKNVENKIEKDQRNRDRMMEEKLRVEDELRSTQINHDAAIRAHKNALIEHDKDLKRLSHKEEVLKRQIIELQKQIAEERYSLNGIIARMSAESAELEKNKRLYEQKKIQYSTKKKELETHLAELTKRVTKTEKNLVDSVNQAVQLNKNIEDMTVNHPKQEADLRQKLETSESDSVSLRADLDRNKSQLEFMKAHIVRMNKNIEEMAVGKENMLKSIENNNRQIQELQTSKIEHTTRCESSRRLHQEAETSLELASTRLTKNTIDHSELMREREVYLDTLFNSLSKYLDVNKELASRYRLLKYHLYNAKIALLQKFEIKLNRLLSVKDKRQMNALQGRMHDALNDFFKFKIRQAELDYEKLEETRKDVSGTIDSIKDNLEKSVHDVTEFLDEQKRIDYGKLRQQVNQKIQKEELIALQKEEKFPIHNSYESYDENLEIH